MSLSLFSMACGAYESHVPVPKSEIIQHTRDLPWFYVLVEEIIQFAEIRSVMTKEKFYQYLLQVERIYLRDARDRREPVSTSYQILLLIVREVDFRIRESIHIPPLKENELYIAISNFYNYINIQIKRLQVMRPM